MEINHCKKPKYLWIVMSALFWFSSINYSPAAETGTIRIGQSHQVLSVICIVAEDQGYFAKEGLKVTVKDYPSGSQALNNGLFGGEVDVITAAEVPIVFSSFTRNDFSILASIGTIDSYSKIVAGTKSGMRKPVDLRGKRIATQKGSGVHFYLHLFLLKNHLSEKDVKLSYVKIDELPDALASGRIDAFSSTDLSMVQARDKLGSEGIAVFEEPNLYAYTSVLVSFKKFVNDNPEAVKSILKALIRSEEFIKKQPEEAMKIVGKKLNMPVSELAETWSRSSFKVQLPQSMILALEDEARWALDSKLVESSTLPNYLNYIHHRQPEICTAKICRDNTVRRQNSISYIAYSISYDMRHTIYDIRTKRRHQ